MGCVACCDGSFEQMAGTLEFRKTMAEFDALHLTMNEVRKLYYAFKRMDVDNSGSITLAELLGHIDLPRTAYTEKIFSIFDNDGSGAIDFREFVLSVWNYCTLTKLNLDLFAFDLYDTDDSQELSPSEVMHLLQDIFGKNEMKNSVHAKSASAEIAAYKDRDEKFNAYSFHKFMMNHQAMLFPAFNMQVSLQNKVCGSRFWDRQTGKRLKRSDGEYVSIAQLLVVNKNSHLHRTVTGLSTEDGSAASLSLSGLSIGSLKSKSRSVSSIEGRNRHKVHAGDHGHSSHSHSSSSSSPHGHSPGSGTTLSRQGLISYEATHSQSPHSQSAASPKQHLQRSHTCATPSSNEITTYTHNHVTPRAAKAHHAAAAQHTSAHTPRRGTSVGTGLGASSSSPRPPLSRQHSKTLHNTASGDSHDTPKSSTAHNNHRSAHHALHRTPSDAHSSDINAVAKHYVATEPQVAEEFMDMESHSFKPFVHHAKKKRHH